MFMKLTCDISLPNVAKFNQKLFSSRVVEEHLLKQAD